MTDNNADETDGQNSKLSRRTALGLMGTSAVGGAAATSAFSQLTADRPVTVDVVSNGDVEMADAGSSELQITNNSGGTVDTEISTADADVQLFGLAGSSSASISGTNPWTLTGLQAGEVADIEFEHSTADTTVGFDVEAFSNTDGFSIASSQQVAVKQTVNTTANIVERFNAQTAFSGSSDGASVTTWAGEEGVYTPSGSGTVRTNGINGYTSVEFNPANSNHFSVGNSNFTDLSVPYTIIAVAEPFFSPSVGKYLSIVHRASGTTPWTQLGWDESNAWSAKTNNVKAMGSDDTSVRLLSGVYSSSGGLREDGTQTATGNYSSTMQSLSIGSLDKGASEVWDGYIGHVEIHNAALSETEIDRREQEIAAQWDL